MDITDGYTDEDLPLSSYALITAAFNAAVVGGLVSAARGKDLPAKLTVADVALLGLAAHKASRLLSKDVVTSFLRAPFVSYEGPGTKNELAEYPRGSGLRRALGELIFCPPCTGLWAAAAGMIGQAKAPRATRALTGMFAAHAVSDFLHLGYEEFLKRF